MKKYYDKISLFSRFINFCFIFTSSKKDSLTEANAKKYIKKLAKNKKEYDLPSKMGLKLEEFKGMKVYSYNGSLEKENDKKLLYIHGGSYIEEANYYQIRFAMNIAEKTNSTLIFPVYPLAPKVNYKTVYNLIDGLYREMLMYSKEINFLGDSAGGGFILSFSMYLRENEKKQPKNIVMLSPWLDISMSNPKLYVYEQKDHMCGVDGTRYEGKLWANGLDLRNYLVSPMFGEFNDLGTMTIIVGGKEILNSDCHILDDKLDKLNIAHNFIEYKGQGHVFGAYPTKEGKMIVDDICNIIMGDYNGK